MGIHLFNPPEPRCNPVRTPANNTSLGTSWRCGNCKCVPTAWKLTVPSAGRFLAERVGTFLLMRVDPRTAVECAWETTVASDLTSPGPLWRLRWGTPPNTALINGEWWIVESGETGPDGPLFLFLHEGEGGLLTDYTWRCLGPNTLTFTLQDGEDEAPGDPVSVSIEPYWK